MTRVARAGGRVGVTRPGLHFGQYHGAGLLNRGAPGVRIGLNPQSVWAARAVPPGGRNPSRDGSPP